LSARGAPVYRLRMNLCAKPGALEPRYVETSFRTRSGRRFRESFDGQTKAAPKQGQLTQGV
jgi:hypothetical protein